MRLFTKRAEDSPNQRRHPRHAAEAHGVRCSLGAVLDLSSGGTRVICDSKPVVVAGQVFRMHVHHKDGRLTLKARCVWRRRKGLKTWQVGLHFLGTSQRVQAQLDSLGRFGKIDDRFVARKLAGGPQLRIQLPDYYQMLQVPPTASPQKIRQQYHVLSKKWHPDVCDQPEAALQFDRIHEAYSVLIDRQRRATYDRSRAA
jgi:hypothetical protein